MSELFESVIAGLDTPAISVGTMLVLFTKACFGLRHFVVSSQLKNPRCPNKNAPVIGMNGRDIVPPLNKRLFVLLPKSEESKMLDW